MSPPQEPLDAYEQKTTDRADARGEADRCLSLTVRAEWAHFRRVEGNIVKQTYRIIPRTTVAGLLAAILGIERDGYYELFASGKSLIAVEPLVPLRTVNVPMNTLSTAEEDINTVPRRGKLRIGLPDPTQPRQQHNYEMLADPAYRLDVWLSDEDRYEALRSKLEAGESHYTPSLGLSECLADVEFLGEYGIAPVEPGEELSVASAVPEALDSVRVEAGSRYRVERSPAFMMADSGGRKTTAFVSYTYDPAGDPLRVSDVRASRVDGRMVMFV